MFLQVGGMAGSICCLFSVGGAACLVGGAAAAAVGLVARVLCHCFACAFAMLLYCYVTALPLVLPRCSCFRC